MRFVSYQDRKVVAAALKPIYTAVNEDAVLMALTAFADSPLGKKYPGRSRLVGERVGTVHPCSWRSGPPCGR